MHKASKLWYQIETSFLYTQGCMEVRQNEALVTTALGGQQNIKIVDHSESVEW